ncbi:MAG: hypothetical protein JXR76_00880, partial [Deltaproteobacteria bacterium]|nr:hypothetical protein [Deltaproteobacteria bacterium]
TDTHADTAPDTHADTNADTAPDTHADTNADTAPDTHADTNADTDSDADYIADPIIPTITETCPVFASGNITFMGLSGIKLIVGPMGSGDGSIVFYWHGTGSSANEATLLMPSSVRDDIIGSGGIIVSFDNSLGTGGDCSGTATFSKDDLNIADQLVACAVRDHNINPRRVYTTGCSAGGLQSGCMGALRANYVAATVPNSGGLVFPQAIQNDDHTPAVMTMHGGVSDWVVVSFAETSATFDAMMDDAGSFVVNCDHNGGHCQAPAELYEAGWEFMKAHPFGVNPFPFETGLVGFPDYCAIY